LLDLAEALAKATQLLKKFPFSGATLTLETDRALDSRVPCEARDAINAWQTQGSRRNLDSFCS
jgi:hypothetical protein